MIGRTITINFEMGGTEASDGNAADDIADYIVDQAGSIKDIFNAMGDYSFSISAIIGEQHG